MVLYGTFGRILSRLPGMNAQDSLVSRHITAQFRWQVGRGQNVIDPLYCFILPFNCSLAFGWLDAVLEEGIKTARVTLVLRGP